MEGDRDQRGAGFTAMSGRVYKFKILSVALCMGIFICLLSLFYFWRGYRYYNAHFQWSGPRTYQEDQELGYKLSPNVSLVSLGRSEFTDARGARISPGEQNKKRVDIIVTGGSFAYGLGLSHRRTFSTQLEEKLGVSTYNIAVSGYGTLTAMLRLRNFLDLKPKVVIYALIDDHLSRNVIPCARSRGNLCRSAPYLAPGEKSGVVVLPPAKEWGGWSFRHFEEIETAHAFGWRDVYWAFLRDWLKVSGQDTAGINARIEKKLPPQFYLDAFRYQLTEWSRLAQQNDFALVVLYIPDLQNPQAARKEILAVLAEMQNKRQLYYVDASPLLGRYLQSQQRGQALCLSADDCHPNAEAQRIFTEALAPKIRPFFD